MAALEAWIARIVDVGHVAVDTETTSLDEMQAELVGISLCVDAGNAPPIFRWAISRAAAICLDRRNWSRGSWSWRPCWLR